MRTIAFLFTLLISTTAFGQFKQGDWDLTLTGSGQSDKDFDTTALSATVGLGYFILDPLEIGVRQQVTFADSEVGGSDFAGATRAFVDYHFNLGQLQPFIGGSVGYSYGDGVESSWVAGPEGGVKFFVNESTYVFGSIGYDFDLEEGFDDGGFVYTVGVGFRF